VAPGPLFGLVDPELELCRLQWSGYEPAFVIFVFLGGTPEKTCCGFRVYNPKWPDNNVIE